MVNIRKTPNVNVTIKINSHLTSIYRIKIFDLRSQDLRSSSHDHGGFENSGFNIKEAKRQSKKSCMLVNHFNDDEHLDRENQKHLTTHSKFF